ncbi:MAG TPA: adenosine kinase, partial [Acidimicrobiales bacterium]
GSAANTAAGVASLGARAGFVGLVRDDLLGGVYAHDLRAAGVAFDVPPAPDGPATGRSLILVTPDAERTMNTFLGAASLLGEAHIDPVTVGRAAVLYLEGYLWDSPSGQRAYRKAIAAARRGGRRVALSLSDPFCVERHREGFRDLIDGGVDLLFGNELEVGLLLGVTDAEDAVAHLQRPGLVTAVTLGGAGSMVVTGDEVVAVPAHPVEHVVDTTGAGDLYAAGFLAGLARGLSWRDCARLGGLAAAEIISHLGARPLASLEKLAVAAGLLPLTPSR